MKEVDFFREGFHNRGQVWVETVIYTLIALTIIGLFLSFARPKVEELQDKSILEQSSQMLEDINVIVLDITQRGAGNQRKVNVGIKKGSLNISASDDTLEFEMQGRYTYTEPGDNGEFGPFVEIGNIVATTRKTGNTNTVKLISNYSDYNITYDGGEEGRKIGKSPTPYELIISNKGIVSGKTQINFEIV